MQTPPSLLDGLALGRQEAWQRLVHLYAPVLHHWARRRHWLQPADADDVVSEVFVALVKELPHFRKDPKKRFRDWLATILRNKSIDYYRRWLASRRRVGDGSGDGPAEPDWTEAFLGREYAQFVAGRALQLLQARFKQAKDWKACWEQVVHDRPAPDVASELGMSVNEAYLAKSRGLRMLRQELHGLRDDVAEN
ncbi:MAG TPA: sigma-70 family RNA polymerase sigma factor [Gemmataceae bacterium]|nr:sigma-70 family RNA polymerase sigma factor [Gemmataceae bacterium]